MDARLVAARLPGLGMYASPYTSPAFPGYLPYGPAAAAAVAASEPSPFFPHMTPGESADAWRASLTQAAAAAYYDPTLAAHYGYGYGAMGLSDGARRKNATRETTSTLKAWLNEHRKNPYPTKGEKIMLAIITKMSLTQVSTWFANARRRLKKENKMTWSPRNRCGEDDDDDDIVDDGTSSNPANNTSRCSTPTVVDADAVNQRSITEPSAGAAANSEVKQISHSSTHASDREGLLDEYNTVHKKKLIGSEQVDKQENSDDGFTERPGSARDKSFGQTGRATLDERKMKNHPGHAARLSTHPYSSPGTPPSHIDPVPTVHPAFIHPNLSFPAALPGQRMLHPGAAIPGKFNPAAAASLLAASRAGHSFPPHLMAALNEQAQLRHYQQTLQNLSMHHALAIPGHENKLAAGCGAGNISPTFGLPAAPRPALPHTTTSNARITSPAKPKIWSIADVATSTPPSKQSESRRSPEVKKSTVTSPTKDLVANLSAASLDSSVAVRRWVDSALHQRMAAMPNNTLPGADSSTHHAFHQFVSNLRPTTPSMLQGSATTEKSLSNHDEKLLMGGKESVRESTPPLGRADRPSLIKSKPRNPNVPPSMSAFTGDDDDDRRCDNADVQKTKST